MHKAVLRNHIYNVTNTNCIIHLHLRNQIKRKNKQLMKNSTTFLRGNATFQHDDDVLKALKTKQSHNSL